MISETSASPLLPLAGAYLSECGFELVRLAAVGHPFDEVVPCETPLAAHAHRGDVARAGDAWRRLFIPMW